MSTHIYFLVWIEVSSTSRSLFTPVIHSGWLHYLSIIVYRVGNHQKVIFLLSLSFYWKVSPVPSPCSGYLLEFREVFGGFVKFPDEWAAAVVWCVVISCTNWNKIIFWFIFNALINVKIIFWPYARLCRLISDLGRCENNNYESVANDSDQR